MAYVRKTRDRWDIETSWVPGEWDVECSEYTWKEAKEQYRCYMENLALYHNCLGLRIKKRREKLED